LHAVHDVFHPAFVHQRGDAFPQRHVDVLTLPCQFSRYERPANCRGSVDAAVGVAVGNADLLRRTLQDFRISFTTLTPTEQSEALQCVLKGVTVHPHKLALEVFELEEFHPGSLNRKAWLPGLDSN